LWAAGANSPSMQVGRWDRFEVSVKNPRRYTDPYRDVSLDATYTRPDGSHIDFAGFYDGGNTWKIRFMPDQVGTWTYETAFSDGAPGIRGAFECTASDLPGILASDEANPIWFGHKGGRHVLVRSFHVGDRFFAANWPESERKAFLDWAQAQGYNMLSIASHYLNRDVKGRGRGWKTPELWPLDASEYQKAEAILDELRDRRVFVFPFAGVFGKNSNYPRNRDDQELYMKYVLARFGPYWNLLLNVAGPEPNVGSGWMDESEVARLGRRLRELDVFGHPLAVHNRTGNDPYRDSAWTSYGVLQGPKTTDRTRLHRGLLRNHHPAKPLYAQETLWSGNKNHPSYSDTDIRKNAWAINMAATAFCFGDMDGNSSSGFSGSMDLADRNQKRHDIVRRVWDFFETVPFCRMSPRQDLVDRGFCLTEPGREYLVYLESRGTVNVSIAGGAYAVEWINGQDPADRRSGDTTTDGRSLASPREGDDWLLRLRRRR
jgi:hypothetical protein